MPIHKISYILRQGLTTLKYYFDTCWAHDYRENKNSDWFETCSSCETLRNLLEQEWSLEVTCRIFVGISFLDFASRPNKNDARQQINYAVDHWRDNGKRFWYGSTHNFENDKNLPYQSENNFSKTWKIEHTILVIRMTMFMVLVMRSCRCR